MREKLHKSARKTGSQTMRLDRKRRHFWATDNEKDEWLGIRTHT